MAAAPGRTRGVAAISFLLHSGRSGADTPLCLRGYADRIFPEAPPLRLRTKTDIQRRPDATPTTYNRNRQLLTMTLSNRCHKFLQTAILSAAAALSLGLTSCESIFDDEGDCSVHYQLAFRFSKNIMNTDAFASQVSSVNVALYDSNGRMVYHKSEQRDLSEENDFRMDLDVAPGTYDIIAWCGGTSPVAGAASFNLLGQQQGDAITSSGASLQLSGSDGSLYFDKDINPLYYGTLTGVTFDPKAYGNVEVGTIRLTKDTNHITLQLMNMDGNPIDPAVLTLELEAQNSALDWKNLLASPAKFTYRPWDVRSIMASVPNDDTAAASRGSMDDDEKPNGVQAEFTTGRIMANAEQILTVRHLDDPEPVLRFRLVQYLLLVRNKYQEAESDQDYLDRYDDFTLLFFIDKGYVWQKSRIYINNWRVVPPQDEVLGK